MQLQFHKPPRLRNPFRVVVQRFVNSFSRGFGRRQGQQRRCTDLVSTCRLGRSSFNVRYYPSTSKTRSRTDVTFGDMNAHQHKHRWILSVRFPF